MVHAAWDLSNEILLAGESRLTYFTVRNTLRLQMKQKKKKCFFALHRTKSFSFYMALIKPSGEWHFPGPTVKHGLLHMQTNTHGQNACKCLHPLSSFFLSHSHLCPLIFWSKSKFFFYVALKSDSFMRPPNITTVVNRSDCNPLMRLPLSLSPILVSLFLFFYHNIDWHSVQSEFDIWQVLIHTETDNFVNMKHVFHSQWDTRI